MVRGDILGRGVAPPILTLLRTIREHRGAFEYDWRARFGLRLDVPGSMTYGEAWRLTQVLLGDPSSHVAAAVAGWDHPWSWEALALADLYDAFVAVNTPKKKQSAIKKYPRPWPDRSKSRPRPTVTPEVAIAALRAAGHTKALPRRFQHLETVA